MGEVYRAHDPKLNRDVALKVLPDDFATDPERLARFKREAQVLASLNHPNIAAIYGLEDSGETHALVLELVEGPTLQDRISQGAIPLDEALPIAKQIAEALEAAHEQGIIHRDLKPANVKVTPEGVVKVLDFGLAKALEPEVSEVEAANLPTMTASATTMGVVMGTPAYMSPEQASGKPVDRRTDIWAFGAVLYEMLAKSRAFAGDDASATLARVIERDPDWSALPNDLPPVLGRFLKCCLAKDAKKRIRDMADVGLAIDGTFEAPVGVRGEAATVPRAEWPRPALAALVGVSLVIIGVVAGRVMLTPTDASPGIARFSIVPSDIAPMGPSPFSRDLAISADGRWVVYSSGGGSESSRLYLRSIDRMESVVLRGGDGFEPFFSPDGRWVGFYDFDNATLNKVSTAGGPPARLTVSPRVIRGATWGTDDQIVFGTEGGGLLRVSGDGGEREVLTTLDPDQDVTSHTWPFVIPDRQAVLFVMSSGPALETGRIAVLDLASGEITDLDLEGVSPRYVPAGHLVYATADGSVHAVAFDATNLSVRGRPVPLIEGVWVKDSGAANFSVSNTGTLVYLPGDEVARQRRLVWVDRDGREEPIDAAPRAYGGLRLSPDGERVAFTLFQGTDADVVVYDLVRDISTRLTFDTAMDSGPIWTPDGRRIVFRSNRGGDVHNLWWKAADGTGAAVRLTTSANFQWPQTWSADGDALVAVELVDVTGTDVILVRLDPDRPTEALVSDPLFQTYPQVSSGGRWMAYQSDESGQNEVYVRPFPNVGDGKWQVSVDGGTYPLWAPDDRELFFRRPDDSSMMVVSVDAESSFSHGSPTRLFDSERYPATLRLDRAFDLAPDGRRFLMLSATGAELEIAVVLNWHEELEARVPTEQ